MEEKKNNAVEKVENIVNQNQVDMQNQNIANPGAVETAPIMAQNIQAQRVVERNKRKEERNKEI